jgi:hypothetical protein
MEDPKRAADVYVDGLLTAQGSPGIHESSLFALTGP